ncbi:MAG TPA: gas vesicle protein K [Gemmatimonadaceae bacterium]
MVDRAPDDGHRDPGEPRVEVSRGSAAAFAEELRALAPTLPERINADPDRVENGLARLVLTLIELLRNVLEHQAVRRMDGGALSDEEVERLGLALMRLDERMRELKATFGLTDEDLTIDLGPLGRLG